MQQNRRTEGQPMQVFIGNDEFVQLQAQLIAASNEEKISVQLVLAWHMRQRDTQQALLLLAGCEELASQAHDCLEGHSYPVPLDLAARGALIRGEAEALYNHPDVARSLLSEAQQAFQTLEDWAGQSDVLRVLAQLETEVGNAARSADLLQQAIDMASMVSDASRIRLCQAMLGIAHAFKDPDTALLTWQVHFDLTHAEIVEAACMHHFFAYCYGLKSELATAIGHWINAHDMGMRSGQQQLAMRAASNVGVAFNGLNEHHAAMEWSESALDLARRNGWPVQIALGLLQTAETLRHQGQLEAAGPLLDEAEVMFANIPESRNFALAHSYQGELAQDKGEHAKALHYFAKSKACAQTLGHGDLEQVAERGMAQALLATGQPQAALAAALRALVLAEQRQDGFNIIDALKVLAKIHALFPRANLPGPDGIPPADISLYYLEKAQTLAGTISGYLMGDSLTQALGHEYAKRGDFLSAYQVVCKGNHDRDKAHRQEVTNRAVAMRVQHQTSIAMVEGEHHRQLALSEAKRSSVLQQTSDTLERLCEIGGEIASKLDLPIVFEALARHVQELLSPSSFVVFLKDADGQHMNMVFGIEQGQRIPGIRFLLSNANSYSVRCLRERREIVVDQPPESNPTHIPGTIPSMSALYVPLAVGERVFGVVSVQSLHRYAFGEREQLVFRTLCAYGAIALDNAHAYRQLHDAHAHLVTQEKLAALGSLVAGVAHELNTPLGNCLMITSALQAANASMLEKMSAPALRRIDLDTFLHEHGEATAVIMRGLSSATELVNSFKQVALDRSTAQRRIFKLAQTSRDIVATLSNQIKHAGHHLHLEMDEDIEMTSYPGPYGQVITNLINNAMLHAFDDGRERGHMYLSASLRDSETATIVFADDGVGISADHIKRIFDPFFTTKMGQGGSGLGMSISYNLVTSILHGQIRVESTPGIGTRFILDLPLFVALEQ